MITVAICDDEPIEVKALRHFLEIFSMRTQTPFHIREFKSGDQLLNFLATGERFDLYLLDIMMPGQDGIMLGKNIRNHDKESLIVYITSSPDFALQSYEVRAFYYLIKPLSEDKLFPILHEITNLVSDKKKREVAVKTRDGQVLIDFDNLMYAELSGRAIQYHVIGGEPVQSVTFSGSFKRVIEPILADNRFVMGGASFLLNLQYIRLVDKQGVVLTDYTRINLPKSACKGLSDKWNAWWLDHDGKEEKAKKQG
ncbi:MAG: response regulator transcription factor [Lachnospiraceae bacterium]|nr:response regulator transcription factor [Lachnospiraceae bacterium]